MTVAQAQQVEGTARVITSAEDELQQRRQDVLDTFTSEAGERVLQRLMDGNGVKHTTFVAGDPYSTAYMEGKRSVVLEILGTMGRALTPEHFVQKEH